MTTEWLSTTTEALDGLAGCIGYLKTRAEAAYTLGLHDLSESLFDTCHALDAHASKIRCAMSSKLDADCKQARAAALAVTTATKE